jgi:hypothetical protein
MLSNQNIFLAFVAACLSAVRIVKAEIPVGGFCEHKILESTFFKLTIAITNSTQAQVLWDQYMYAKMNVLFAKIDNFLQDSCGSLNACGRLVAHQ